MRGQSLNAPEKGQEDESRNRRMARHGRISPHAAHAGGE